MLLIACLLVESAVLTVSIFFYSTDVNVAVDLDHPFLSDITTLLTHDGTTITLFVSTSSVVVVVVVVA